MTNPDLAHNSNTCKYPAKGHDKTATLYNMCGGNNYFCQIPNKKVVYKHEMYNDRKHKHKGKAASPETKKMQDKWRWGEPRIIPDDNNKANHVNKLFTDRAHTIQDILCPSTNNQYQLIIDTSRTRHFLATTTPIKNKTITQDGTYQIRKQWQPHIQLNWTSQLTSGSMHCPHIPCPWHHIAAVHWSALWCKLYYNIHRQNSHYHPQQQDNPQWTTKH